ncbi:hypothetical protein TK5_00510 [Sideroxyarcus sp. TK5]
MFGTEIEMQIERELELEIERKCLLLRLDCNDHAALHHFAHDVLSHLESYGKAAASGDMQARIKIELYGLAVLMHKANVTTFGPAYMTQLDALSRQQGAWVNIAQAIWSELETRNVMSNLRNEQA